jgi:hypothetical protein
MLGCLKQGAFKEEEKEKSDFLIPHCSFWQGFFKKMQNAPRALGTLFFYN